MNVRNYGSFIFIVGSKAGFAVIVTCDGKVHRFSGEEIDSWFRKPEQQP